MSDHDNKTKEELLAELNLREAMELMRQTSDQLYAIKLVERIVFGMIGVITLAVLSAMVYLVIK